MPGQKIGHDGDGLASVQERLARRVNSNVQIERIPELLCGLDAAYSGTSGIGVAAVLKTRSGELVETASARMDRVLEYRPGLFGFREGPLLVGAASRLRSDPDIFIVEGHGLAHPRRFGLACHVGLALNKPTVGVARNLLYGSQTGPSIVDPDGKVIGRAVPVRGRERPLYVSVGHKINLSSAVRIVQLSLQGSANYPLTLRMAHQESVRLRNRYLHG